MSWGASRRPRPRRPPPRPETSAAPTLLAPVSDPDFDPRNHPCVVCGEWGSIAVERFPGQPGRWFCAGHVALADQSRGAP